jgi:hypothetical protein
VPEDCKEEIFEAATFRDDSAFVDGYFDNLNENGRKQMKQVQTGAQSTKWKQYKEQYGLQAAQIIEGFTHHAETPGILGPNSVKRPTRTSNPILSDDQFVVSYPNLGGQFVVSYPVRNTMLLRFPFTQEECKELGIEYLPPGEFDKEERAKLKKTLSSQLNMRIYNV